MSEQERIEEAVRKAELPGYVEKFECKLDLDATGDRAAWIWVILSDEIAESDSFGDAISLIRRKIWDAFEEAEIDRRPYIRFRSASEQAALGTRQ